MTVTGLRGHQRLVAVAGGLALAGLLWPGLLYGNGPGAGARPSAASVRAYVARYTADVAAAHASIPAFARKYHLSCNVCHTRQPRLNAFGQRFQENGYQLPGTEDGGVAGKGLYGGPGPERGVRLDDVGNFLAARLRGEVQQSFTREETVSQDPNLGSFPNTINVFLAGTVTKNVSFLPHISPIALGLAAGLVGTGPLVAQAPMAATPDSARPARNAQTIALGKRAYDRSCVYCHGVAGRGDGPVAFFLNRNYAPQPRDFTEGRFKFRSTPSGQPATDDDLFRTVTRGIPGFMPAFAGLAPAERWEVIYYVQSFMPEQSRAIVLQPIPITGGPVPMSESSVRHGHALYEQLQCWQSHGAGGHGNGPQASGLEDDWAYRIRPANLTRPSAFKNGTRPEDIYRTIATGLDGTPMASFIDVMRGREGEIWDLVNFVRSLSEE